LGWWWAFYKQYIQHKFYVNWSSNLKVNYFCNYTNRIRHIWWPRTKCSEFHHKFTYNWSQLQILAGKSQPPQEHKYCAPNWATYHILAVCRRYRFCVNDHQQSQNTAKQSRAFLTLPSSLRLRNWISTFLENTIATNWLNCTPVLLWDFTMMIQYNYLNTLPEINSTRTWFKIDFI
jgi:hypothetical protein